MGELWILTFGMLILAVVPMILEIHSGRFDLFHPKNLFIIYYTIQLGGYMTYVLATGETLIPWMGLDNAANIATYSTVMIMVIVGLTCFKVGHALRLGDRIARKLPAFPNWDRARLGWIFALGSLIAAFTGYLFLELQGGIGSFVFNLGSWRGSGMIGQGYLLYPATGVPRTISLLLFVHVLRNPNISRISIVSLIYILSLIPTFCAGFRGTLCISLIQFAALWHYGYRPLPLKKMIVYFGVGMVLLTAYGIGRANISEGLDLWELRDVSADTLARPVLLRSAGPEIVATVVDRLGQTGDFQYWWESILESTTIMIPRKLWSYKPMPRMMAFGFDFMADFLCSRDGQVSEETGGFSPTIVGFYYWQMGWAGVVIGMLIMGVAARAAYTYWLIDTRDPSRIMLYTTFLSAFVFFAESPQDGLNNLVTSFVFTCCFLGVLTIGRRRRESLLNAVSFAYVD